MPVELGFLEEVNTEKLVSRLFPSKVGGYPAWLDLKNLPNFENLLCDVCEKPCVFLLQMYAPGSVGLPHTFHRSVYVFMCKNSECCKNKNVGNFKVFRCQLPRKNLYYSYDPPSDYSKSDTESESDSNDDQHEGGQLNEMENGHTITSLPKLDPLIQAVSKLCIVCGCQGSKHCSNCKAVNYCCRFHQRLDWKAGHKSDCTLASDSKFLQTSKSQVILPEFEIVSEPEVISKEDSNNSETYESEFENDSSCKLHENELEQMAKKDDDKFFTRFKTLMSYHPHQVVRYERHSKPVWISEENIPSDCDIPPCICGAKRSFEFQILPQLLNHLKLDSVEKSVDWGTLSIYTCSNDCSDENSAYHQEFLWKQDVSIKN